MCQAARKPTPTATAPRIVAALDLGVGAPNLELGTAVAEDAEAAVPDLDLWVLISAVADIATDVTQTQGFPSTVAHAKSPIATANLEA